MGKLKKPKAGWYVQEWLEVLDLKQRDIVARTVYSKSQVSEWVSGKRRFNGDVLAAFASAMGVSQSDLLAPPAPAQNELHNYISGLDVNEQRKALRILKSALEDDAA